MNDVLKTSVPYCGAAPNPANWSEQWNFDPFLIGIVAALLMFGFVRSRATISSQLAASLVVTVLFVSPLCALGSALFAFRAAHHLVLVLVLAPLLVAAIGPVVSRLSVPLALATLAQALIFWAWHAPSAYQAALANDAMFWIMQLTIVVSAMAWWIALRGVSPLAAVVSILSTTVQMGLLGALIVFSGRPLYAPHWLTTAPWGLVPLEDQQIAGLLMWVAGGGAYLALAATLLYRALGPSPVARAA